MRNRTNRWLAFVAPAIFTLALACFAAPALALGSIPSAIGSGSDATSDTTSDTTSNTTLQPTETSIYTYNLPGNISDCVGLYPKPGCGTEPVLSGDRGGMMQYATFAALIAGLTVIMTVIARNVIRTDRAKAQQVSQKPNN